MKQLSEVSKFNELLWLLPGLADELKVAISAEIKKEAERKHALRLISEFQLLKDAIELTVEHQYQICLKEFELSLSYQECNVPMYDYRALFLYVDNLCKKINAISPTLKFYPTGAAVVNNFQTKLTIHWYF